MADEKNTPNEVTFGDVRKRLAERAEEFATYVLGESPARRNGREIRYFENESLSVTISGHGRGKFVWWVDESIHGSMIDLAKWRNSLSDRDALEFCKTWLGIGKGELPDLPQPKTDDEIQKEIDEDEAKRLRTARWIWTTSSPTDGRSEGLAYLRNRGITCDVPSDVLRFRKLTRADLEKMGLAPNEIPQTPVVALVFAARNIAGEVQAVQQVLTSEGKKLAISNPKKSNGILRGAAVQLGDIKSATELNMVEGPETALSVWQATGVPTMITLGKSNFMSVDILKSIETLKIGVDMEPNGVGLGTALKAAQFWKRRGLKNSGLAIPPKLNDGDFNDVHQKFGAEAVKAAFDKAHFAPEHDTDGTVLITADSRSAFFVWTQTGIEVNPKIPGRKPDGTYLPISLDTVVEDRHTRVLLIKSPGIEIRDEFLVKNRPNIEIVTLHENTKEFRKLAKSKGKIAEIISSLDFYAPDGQGKDEPVFFSLRRKDADALKLDGYKSMAIRSAAIDKADLTFMRGREAIVAPLGNGTEADMKLTKQLETAGARVTRLTWQIFRGDAVPEQIIRREVPDLFGAAEAAELEGWSGKSLESLVSISKANLKQIRMQEALERKLAQAKPGKPESVTSPSEAER